MNKKILLVDDDSAILHALTARLSHLGYDVLARTDAFSVLGEVERHMPKLAIIDVNLPGLNGFELAEKLDEMSDQNDKTKKIFMTASMNPDLRQTAMQFDPDGFLEKPYNPQDLIGLVETCMAS